MAEAGQFQHRTHVFCVDWEDYESHTMQGFSGIVIQSEKSNTATVLAFDFGGKTMKIGTAIDSWNNFAWRRTI